MIKKQINLQEAYSIDEVHERLASGLGLPAYYGKNLDALYDCLTDIAEDTCVGIYAPADPERAEYVRRVQRVCEDAEEENGHLCVFFFFPEERPVQFSGNPFDANFVPDPEDAELMGWYGMDQTPECDGNEE